MQMSHRLAALPDGCSIEPSWRESLNSIWPCGKSVTIGGVFDWGSLDDPIQGGRGWGRLGGCGGDKPNEWLFSVFENDHLSKGQDLSVCDKCDPLL